MKIHNVILKSLSLSAFLTPIFVGVTSCGNKVENIDKIVLSSDANCLMPSQSTLIRAIAAPSNIRIKENLLWELFDCPFKEVRLDQNGLLSVPSTTDVQELTKITIKVTYKLIPEIFNFMSIYIAPYSTSSFVGFANNEIRYLTKDMMPASMKIIKTGDFTYENESPIDIYQMDYRSRPEEFYSPVLFTPLIVGDSYKYMNFKFSGETDPDHALVWKNGYNEESWTDTIPDFEVKNCALLNDSIKVHFACDERICLTINFNTWLNPEQEAGITYLAYQPEEGNPHSIKETSASRYISYLFCPGEEKEGIYSGYMNSIYCFKPKYEECTLQFDFELNNMLDEEIKNCFDFKYEVQRFQRSFDNFTYYEINFSYTFDLSKKEHLAEYWDYHSFLLLNLTVRDTTLLAPSSYCDFYIEWI